MGAYTAFLDVALGFGTPALGLLADVAGLSARVLGQRRRGALRSAYRGVFSAFIPQPSNTSASCGVRVSRLHVHRQELAMKLLATAALASLALIGSFAHSGGDQHDVERPPSREDIRAVAPAL